MVDLRLLHDSSGYCAGNCAHACIVAAAATREDRGSHRGNLDEDEDVDDREQDDEGKVLQHLDWVCKVHEVRRGGHIQMSENTHRRGGNHLVKREAEKGPEPSPEQKLQLLDDEKRNED